jgi:hypothetical protein
VTAHSDKPQMTRRATFRTALFRIQPPVKSGQIMRAAAILRWPYPIYPDDTDEKFGQGGSNTWEARQTGFVGCATITRPRCYKARLQSVA